MAQLQRRRAPLRTARGGAATASPAVRLWQALEAGAWDEARALLDTRFVASWPQSGEAFDADAYLAVNRVHPAPGWRLAVHHVVDGPRHCALHLTLEHLEGIEHGACFYVVARDRILAATELWAERTEPPAWRIALGAAAPA